MSNYSNYYNKVPECDKIIASVSLGASSNPAQRSEFLEDLEGFSGRLYILLRSLGLAVSVV